MNKSGESGRVLLMKKALGRDDSWRAARDLATLAAIVRRKS